MVVVKCGCAEGEKGAGGKRSSREEDRTGKEEEKSVQAVKGGGKEIGCDNDKAFSAGRGGRFACEGDLLPYCACEFG